MRALRFYIGGCHRCVLVLWLICQVTRGGFCAEPAAKTDPIISLAEILKRWQAVSLSEAVAAAEKGDLTAQHFLGYYHVEGLGGKVNREEGMRWYLRAADAGFPNSLNNLGVIYLNGNGVAKDETKALDYFKRAGERGMWRSVRHAVDIVVRQPGGKEKVAELRQRMEKAARAGDAEAQVHLGQLLLEPPDGIQREEENAVYMFKKAAEQGRSDVYPVLGNYYMESHIDYAKALKWHRLGVEKEQAVSETALSWMYFNALGVSHDKAKAYELATRAAEKKYQPAMVNMGRYYAGDDIKNLPDDFQPDYRQAIEWYERAAMQGNSRATQYLAKLMAQGSVTARDREKVRASLQKASEQEAGKAKKAPSSVKMETTGMPDEIAVLEQKALKNDNSAVLRLAEKYLYGKSVPQDFYHAIRLYQYAKDRGDREAKQALAVIDEKGQPVGGLAGEQTVLALVYGYFSQAYKQKNAAFFYQLGENYLKGDGVPEDLAEASLWFLVSAKYGHSGAQKRADETAARLSDQQKEMMRFWFAGLNKP